MSEKATNPWDVRYAAAPYFYGTTPNGFLAASLPHIRQSGGAVLSLGEGEGRNAVFLAQAGFKVTGVDASRVGLQKAQQLADARGVSIETITADLADFDFGLARFDAIVSIFCHLSQPLRSELHRRAKAALRPGGAFLLEAYTSEQLRFATGGPRDAGLFYSAAELREDFSGFEINLAQEHQREVVEGTGHTGMAAVVQFVATRP